MNWTHNEVKGLQTAQQDATTLSRCSANQTEQHHATLALPSQSPPSESFCETKYVHNVIKSHPVTYNMLIRNTTKPTSATD